MRNWRHVRQVDRRDYRNNRFRCPSAGVAFRLFKKERRNYNSVLKI
jgi:hypothetical protein